MKILSWYHTLAETAWERRATVVLLVAIVLLPLQRRVQFNTPGTNLTGTFTEYSTYFLYGTDLLLLAFAVLSVIAIWKRGDERSLVQQGVVRMLFGYLAVVILLLPFSTQLPHSLYYVVRLFLLVAFSLGIFYLGQNSRIRPRILASIVVAGIFQSLIAILQFTLQQSLGLFYITGESQLSPSIENVAKVIIDGDRFIRAYGTFPHPNILAAFLVLSLMAAIVLIPRVIEKNRPLLALAVTTCLLIWGLMVTLSRASFLYGAIFGVTLVIYMLHVKLKTWKSFHVKRLVFILSLIILFTGTLAATNWQFLSARFTTGNTAGDVSATMRDQLDALSHTMIAQHPWTGTGLNTVVLNEIRLAPDSESWTYQPIHNIYRLILVEGGVSLLAAFLLLLGMITWKAALRIKNTPQIYGAFGLAGLGFLLAIGFYDHFLLTLQQGQMMLWLMIGATLPMFHKKR